MAQKKMGAFGQSMFCLLAFLALGGCSRQNQQANSIQIKGSDTMVNLGQAWAEAFMKANPKVSVAVTGGGSGTGIAALLSNTCDIAELSRELKPEEIEMAKQKGFRTQADHGGPGRPGRGGPSRQPDVATDHGPAGRDLFRVGHATGRRSAAATCPSSSCRARSIPAPMSISRSTCCAAASKDSQVEFAANALMLSSSQAIADEVAQNPGAIGYYGMGYISAKEKALAIAKDAEFAYVQPTIENVVSKAYPISRPLLMVTRGQPLGWWPASSISSSAPRGRRSSPRSISCR